MLLCLPLLPIVTRRPAKYGPSHRRRVAGPNDRRPAAHGCERLQLVYIYLRIVITGIDIALCILRYRIMVLRYLVCAVYTTHVHASSFSRMAYDVVIDCVRPPETTIYGPACLATGYLRRRKKKYPVNTR